MMVETAAVVVKGGGGGVLDIFTDDFTVTFTFQQVGWGSYVTNFGPLAGDVT